MNAAKRKALDAMATGAPLYIYVEPEQFNLLYDGLVPGGCYPTPGSGVIVSLPLLSRFAGIAAAPTGGSEGVEGIG